MQQEKWHQQEQVVIGIQISPTSRTRTTLGSSVGAATMKVRTRVLSTSAAAMVMCAIPSRSVCRLLRPLEGQFKINKNTLSKKLRIFFFKNNYHFLITFALAVLTGLSLSLLTISLYITPKPKIKEIK